LWPANSPLAGRYHASLAHEEALARLHFLAENRSRLGLLLGDAGSGKSLLCARFADELRQHGTAVAAMTCIGLSERELLFNVLMDWGCSPAESDADFQLARRVADRIVELRYEKIPAVLLLDDAHAAARELVTAIERLAASDPCGSGLTIVGAAEPEGAINLGLRLLDLAELRIELLPWEAADVQTFVHIAQTAAGDRTPFEPSATARLQELSHGLPRKVQQLTQLALVARAGQELPVVDAATIDAVYEELSVAR
jgi:general secretion pathway protein A